LHIGIPHRSVVKLILLKISDKKVSHTRVNMIDVSRFGNRVPNVKWSLKISFLAAGASSVRSVVSMSMSEHTTLLHDEAESFALEPVESSAIRGQVLL